MRLLDAGETPRKALRYAWHPGRSENLAIELHTSASTQEGDVKQPEIPLPPVRIVVAIDPRSVSPSGDLTYGWRVTSTAVTAEPQTPPSVAQGMSAEVAAIEHVEGTGVVSSRGLTSKVTIETPPRNDASAGDATGAMGTTGQMVEQVLQTLRDVAAPFPEEEIGRGARWEKLSQLASRDARVTQTETFTLTDFAGTTGALDDILAQTAPPQPLLAPGSDGSAQARIDSMLASGDGKTRFDLGRLVPQTKFEGTTTMVVSGRLPDDRPENGRKMTMVMRVAISIDGSLP
jgi:hypothetical protein